MLDIHSILGNLKRPRLLVRAARIGAEEYRRKSHLPRALGTLDLPKPAQSALRLVEIEAEINEMRMTGDGKYSIARHIEVLIALIGEARSLKTESSAQILKFSA